MKHKKKIILCQDYAIILQKTHLIDMRQALRVMHTLETRKRNGNALI